MKLPHASLGYDPVNEAQTRSALEIADGRNVKVDGVLSKLQMRDTVSGKIVTVTVASGAWVLTVPT